MKREIKIMAEPSENRCTFRVSFDELGTTEREWQALGHDDKNKLIGEYLDSLHEQPYWQLINYERTNDHILSI